MKSMLVVRSLSCANVGVLLLAVRLKLDWVKKHRAG